MNEYNMPDMTLHCLKEYVENRVPPGGFLYAVLTNNLIESFGRADEGNSASLQQIVRYLYNEMPADCWGSPAKVKAWLESDEAKAIQAKVAEDARNNYKG